jgi:hypothetical protein
MAIPTDLPGSAGERAVMIEFLGFLDHRAENMHQDCKEDAQPQGITRASTATSPVRGRERLLYAGLLDAVFAGYQLSPKGRSSTLNDHALRSC